MHEISGHDLKWVEDTYKERYMPAPQEMATRFCKMHKKDFSNVKKLAMDIEYIEKITFLGDVKIILATVKSVLLREGISSETSATMEDFADYVKSKETKEKVEV